VRIGIEVGDVGCAGAVAEANRHLAHAPAAQAPHVVAAPERMEIGGDDADGREAEIANVVGGYVDCDGLDAGGG
jgi:hypothetical protein